MAKKIIKKIENIFTAKVSEMFKTEKEEISLEQMKINLLGIKKDELSDFKSKMIIEDDDELNKMKKALLNPVVEEPPVVEENSTNNIEEIKETQSINYDIINTGNIDGLCDAKPPFLETLENDYNDILKKELEKKKEKKPKKIIFEQKISIKEKVNYKIIDTDYEDKIIRTIEISNDNFITLDISKINNNYQYYLNISLTNFYVYHFDKIIFSSIDFIDNDNDNSNNILEITKDKIHFNGLYYSIHTIQFSNTKY